MPGTPPYISAMGQQRWTPQQSDNTLAQAQLMITNVNGWRRKQEKMKIGPHDQHHIKQA